MCIQLTFPHLKPWSNCWEEVTRSPRRGADCGLCPTLHYIGRDTISWEQFGWWSSSGQLGHCYLSVTDRVWLLLVVTVCQEWPLVVNCCQQVYLVVIDSNHVNPGTINCHHVPHLYWFESRHHRWLAVISRGIIIWKVGICSQKRYSQSPDKL